MVVQPGEFELPPCGRCHKGKLVSDGDTLYCLSCGHEPNLSRLGISKSAMDPLRLMLRVMAFEEQVRTIMEEAAEFSSMATILLDGVGDLRDAIAGIPVSGRFTPVICPKCGFKARSAQGLRSHRRACARSA